MTSEATSGSMSRRDQILAAAAELFSRSGFHGVGIDEIGAAVGISGPALYRHFRSKDAMLAEMLTDISDKLLQGGKARAEAANSPFDALDGLVRWHVAFALDNPALISTQLRDLGCLADAAHRRVREAQREYVEVWVDAVRAIQPELDQPTARASAHAVLALINSTPHSTHLGRPDMAALLRRMALAAFGVTNS